MYFTKNWKSSLPKQVFSIGLSLLALNYPVHALAEEAQESTIEQHQQAPVTGRAIFAKYGIDDDLPKLGLSSLAQGEHLVEHVSRTTKVGDQERRSEVFLVQNTDEKGNIDLRIKYDPSKVDENEDIINEIEANTKIEYRLRKYAQSYDPNSVTATELGNGQVEIAFNYSKFGLPQDIAYFRFMRVKIIAENNQPVRMVIKNTRDFAYQNFRINDYQQVVDFEVHDEGVRIKQKHIQAIGMNKKAQPVSVTTLVEPVVFYDDETHSKVLNEARLSQVSDPRYKEESVKLDRVFPLMSDMVRQQGIDVPLPFGISMAYRNQDMNFGFTDFDIMGIKLNELFDPYKSVAQVNAETLTLRGEMNILPFWNVFGYYGKLNVDAQVDAEYTGEIGRQLQDALNNKLPGLGNALCDELSALCNSGTLSVPLDLHYDLAGIGTTLSVGYKQLFASVTTTYTKTKMEGSDKWSDGILTIQPMLGYQLADYRAQIFVGAEYQGLKPNMEGTIAGVELGGEEFFYNVGVDLNKWAYLIGFNKQFGKNYNLSVLYNKGETRNSFTVNFGYHF
ncbi:hypothetical protein L2737_08425 [Shewanella electrodiphila]|uniref:Uncharacterized protein n=1 Tax=Shewanella electrodiphila TaxID=934143 RepID=A0ABT0KNJ9_9GAMM|nr:hypothetical protein [Shewanella electrodiphila]MCL1045349.1 hypothetical protein [Shewanella electrodiphila]